LGRFIHRDPIGYEAEDVNIYRYVGNKPVSAGDIFGLKVVGLVCAGSCSCAAACLGPGAVVCYRNSNSLEEFYDCFSYYWSILPAWHKTLCASVSAACLGCLARSIRCKLIHAAYKAAGAPCRKCHGLMNKENCKANAACFAAEVAGRSTYLANRCDYFMPGSIRRGSAKAAAGHAQELREKTAAMNRCKACS
jgi:hypothetical protein